MIFNKKLNCFKSYDIRGKIGEELDDGIAYRIGCALGQSLNARTVVLGFDARESSPSLASALARGICDIGADVLEIGLAGTEEMYAAVVQCNACAGVEVTASHNPIDYNGMKIVKRGSQPLSDKEYVNLKKLTEENKFTIPKISGSIIDVKGSARTNFINKIISFIDLNDLKPLKIVINSGNGAAGPTIEALNSKLNEKGLMTNFIHLHKDPDFSFPNGIPNPLLEENQSSTANAVIDEGADFGVAFDGDFDRCFLFDQFGNFIPAEYIIGLLAELFLTKEQEATIIHDSRVVWNTMDIIEKLGGHSKLSNAGHIFFKSAMRESKAIYGGEISAHHYFKDFFYCDSGMIPWLLVWELLSKSNSSLADLVGKRKSMFPSSGEINFEVSDGPSCIQFLKHSMAKEALHIDDYDGLSISFETWRFNLRQSKTEPLVRLNIETRGSEVLLKEKIEEITNLINNI